MTLEFDPVWPWSELRQSLAGASPSALAAVVLAAYWRFLSRREKELDDASVVRQHQRQGAGFSEPHARRPS